MATFYADVEVDVDEFLESLSSRETDELITALIDDGYLKKDCRADESTRPYSIEYQLQEKIESGFWKLSLEDQDTITKILDKIVI